MPLRSPRNRSLCLTLLAASAFAPNLAAQNPPPAVDEEEFRLHLDLAHLPENDTTRAIWHARRQAMDSLESAKWIEFSWIKTLSPHVYGGGRGENHAAVSDAHARLSRAYHDLIEAIDRAYVRGFEPPAPRRVRAQRRRRPHRRRPRRVEHARPRTPTRSRVRGRDGGPAVFARSRANDPDAPARARGT